MDYKELIEQLRDKNNCNVLDYIDDACFNFPCASANTATMIKEGAQAFSPAFGQLIVTREWLANNAALLRNNRVECR